MLPFAIRCTTCGRKLIVKQQAAVGKILPCPACGSMVLVEAPEGSLLPARQSGLPADPVPAASTNVAKLLEVVDVQQADTVDDPLYASDAREEPVAANGARRVGQHTEVVTAVSAPIQPQLWFSRQTQLLRRWVLIGLIGVGAAAALIVAVGYWMGRPEPLASARRSAANSNEPAGSTPDTVSVPQMNEPAPEGNSASELAHEGSDASSTPPDTAAKSSPPLAAGTAPPSETSGETGRSEPLGANQSEESDARGSTTPDRQVGQPVEGTPDAASGERGDSFGRKPLTVEQALRDLEALTTDAPLGRRVLSGTSAYDLIPSPARTFDVGLALPKPPARRGINAANRLAVKIPSLQFRNIPLVAWCRWFQDVTLVPVTIDVDALHRVGLGVNVPIHVEASDEEFGVVLRRSLEPLGLTYHLLNDQVLISVAGVDRMETVEYEVFDLVGNDPEQNRQLGTWIVDLIAPVAWKEYGGPGQLHISEGRLRVTTTRAIQYEVHMFCERLRVARGGRPQGAVPDYVIQLRPRMSLALERLAQSVTIHRAVGTPLVEILDQIGQASDLAIVVDWQGLAADGWTIQSLARLDVEEVSVSEALQQLLGPMQLSFRVIDSGTLQVTTMQRAWVLEEVAFFPLEALWGSDEGRTVLERVRSALGHGQSPAVARGRFLVDPVSRTLMIVAPQYRIAQVAGLLERLAVAREEPAVPVPDLD